MTKPEYPSLIGNCLFGGVLGFCLGSTIAIILIGLTLVINREVSFPLELLYGIIFFSIAGFFYGWSEYDVDLKNYIDNQKEVKAK